METRSVPKPFTQAVIPAGGRGLRAYPKTVWTPKALLEIGGLPIIERTIAILRDGLGIRDVVVIVGHLREQIRQVLGDGSRMGISIRYVDCPNPEIGLARGLMLARDLLQDRFVTILGDEFYLDSNHHELRSLASEGFDAVCGVLRTSDLHQIRKNYAVEVVDGRVTSLVEKPEQILNDLLGCGTYVFSRAIFEAIERTPPSPVSGRVELTDAVHSLAKKGRVLPFYLRGSYFNINTVDDYNLANHRARAEHFHEHRISVVMPAYNEEHSIGYVVRDFRPHVHEVFVVDNSSVDDTARVAREAGARVETVKLKGYGDSIRYGLDQADGTILVVVEADCSFRARDLSKILEYLKDADMVVGTRTTRELIEQGTNMRGPVRWGNVFVAKFVELLWWGQQPRFTDVGCTYRALWKEAYLKIRPLLSGTGPELSPEMMIAALEARRRVIEVPVTYHRRIAGTSKHSANYLAVSKTALRMLRTILRHRFGRSLS